MKTVIISFMICAALGSSLYAQTSTPEDQMDHLALATLMIHDGSYDKASYELARVDPDEPRFDGARYNTLKGVIAAKTGHYRQAIDHYTKAVEATRIKDFSPPKIERERQYLFSIGQSDKPAKEAAIPSGFNPEAVRREKLEKLFLSLAQAYYRVEDYARAAEALDLAGSRGRERAELFSLRADCYWKLQDYHRAIRALNRGIELFPANSSLLKGKYTYYSELNLYNAAGEFAKKYLATIEPEANDYLNLAHLYNLAERLDEAIALLEQVRWVFPDNAKIPMLLGRFYMKSNMDHAAAALFRSAAEIDSKYLSDAVEMLRRIKSYPQAIYLNSQLSDTAEKLKLKVAIHLDRGEFEKVIGLGDSLERYSMLDDDNMRYAFAYASYMAKDYDGAEEQISRINDRELYMKGMVLRNNIEKCRKESTECDQ
ncbi:MAG: tetratricopeptide repeat protein [Proteobacteria bacterium]|nr:tetratricopeptide repeat protein [Pseudomonadota bacterium]MBU1714270.1 tetratricopeptide repeat protein [Pseudomonadota bacterium]